MCHQFIYKIVLFSSFTAFLLNNLGYLCEGTLLIDNSWSFHQSRSAAIRIRLTDQIFQQLSRISGYLYERRVNNVIIPDQQQCFVEGCVRLSNFQIISKRLPTVSIFTANPPNLLKLSFNDFDLHVLGSLYGILQMFPPLPLVVPASGQISFSAQHLNVHTILELQKSLNNTPYMRIVSCNIGRGIINAQADNIGILTDIANFKYQEDMSAKARDVLEETLCSNIANIVHYEFNNRLSKIPSKITARDVFEKVKRMATSNTYLKRKRYKKDGDDHGDSTQLPIKLEAEQGSPKQFNWQLFEDKLNIGKLKSLIFSLELLDSSATFDRFFVGIDGDASIVNRDDVGNPYQRPPSLRFLNLKNEPMIEILISEYTINTFLLRAHSIGAFGAFQIDSRTPVLGELLRTTCSIDEVCLSDSIPEPGEKYPNRQIQVTLRTTVTPQVKFFDGYLIIRAEGRAIFFLEGTTVKIGTIPFETEAKLSIITISHRLTGSLQILRLTVKKDVDFFNLTAETLNSLRDATIGAISNWLNPILKSGIVLYNRNISSSGSYSSITKPILRVTNGAISLQLDYNIEKDFY